MNMTHSMDFTSLGDKCKEWEAVGTSLKFPSRGYLVARLDGHCFHTYTKAFKRPCDDSLLQGMQNVAQRLMEKFTAQAAYVQSDEITLLWSLDDKAEGSLFPFDGKAAKINSVLAGYASVFFERHMNRGATRTYEVAAFDCRCWPLQTKDEVADTFMWRQWDAERNSVNAVASFAIPASKLHKVPTEKRIELLAENGVPWTSFPNSFRFGTLFRNYTVQEKLKPEILAKIPEHKRPDPDTVFTRNYRAKIYPKFRSLTKEQRVDLIFGKVSVPLCSGFEVATLFGEPT